MNGASFQALAGVLAAVVVAVVGCVLAWRGAARRKYDPDDAVTLATFSTANEAEVWAMRLRSQGVQCFVVGGVHARVMPLVDPEAAGARLQVRASDLQRARAVISRS